MSAERPYSGEQLTVTDGRLTAEIASVGASLRTLRAGARDLVVPFDADAVRPAYRGASLAPWPNRVVGGRYPFRGAMHELALTEPARGHALHGLVCWSDFAVRARHDARVALGTTITPQTGYPFRLDIEVEYRIDAGALVTTIAATNTGREHAPYGASGHPYLVAGPGRVDDWSVEIAATTVLDVDAERLIPLGTRPAAELGFDFGRPTPLAGVAIDHAFTDIARDETGSAELRLTAADGHGVALRFDTAAPWLQLHTADRPEPEQHRLGLAAEPMTCPPDAFNSGIDLVLLAPGERHEVSWTIAPI